MKKTILIPIILAQVTFLLAGAFTVLNRTNNVKVLKNKSVLQNFSTPHMFPHLEAILQPDYSNFHIFSHLKAKNLHRNTLKTCTKKQQKCCNLIYEHKMMSAKNHSYLIKSKLYMPTVLISHLRN